MDGAHRAARHAAPWVVRLARLGLATKGVVYLLIGMLAVFAAAHAGGGMMDAYGAANVIGGAPFGKALLGLAGVGLVGYSLWRLIMGAWNPEGEPQSVKGYLRRVGYLCSAAAYGGVAVGAFKVLRGAEKHLSDHTTQSHVARLLAGPLGWQLTTLAGGAVLVAALAQFLEAYQANFQKLLEIDGRRRRFVVPLARLGLAARGVVFGVIGLFLIQAGLQQNAERAKGIGGALKALSHQTLGPALLGAVAAGLIAYGISMLVESRYRRISV